MFLYRSLSVVVLLLLLTGCSPKMAIKYKVDDITPSKNEKLSAYVLDIENYEDARGTEEINQLWLTGDRNVSMDGKQYCINADKYYGESSVSNQITKMIVEHLKAKGTYKDVVLNQKDEADFFISGKIRKFSGKREYSLSAATALAVGMQFGAIGGLISSLSVSAMSSPGAVDITFSDIIIHNKKGEEVVKIGNISENYQGDMSIDGYCWSIYPATNGVLKNAVEKNAAAIENAMIGFLEKNGPDTSKATNTSTAQDVKQANEAAVQRDIP